MNSAVPNSNTNFNQLESRIRHLEDEHQWEYSPLRIGIIVCMIYTVASTLLYSIDATKPFLNGLVPTISYMFSMLPLTTIHQKLARKH